MEELSDSHHEQGDTIKSKCTTKDHQEMSSSSRFISQTEEDFDNLNSEISNSVSDKKSQARGRKRIMKANGKSEAPSGTQSLSNQSETNKSRSGTSKKKKKTEQYKNQIIVDQYGTFEFDKDPEGYKKARKRQQNRESALRARDKRTNKMESVETTLEKIERKSTNLEKENLVLKAEKRQLQDQVKNLLSIITSFGQNKRFKTGEQEEVCDKKSSDNIISTDMPLELNEPSECDLNLMDDESIQLSPKGSSPETVMLRLIRKDQNSIFNGDDSSGYGDLFQKGMMLSLTVVMCMILCLTGFSLSENYYSSSIKMCNTCKAARNPFGLQSTDSKSLMSHPFEPHYEYNGGYTMLSETNILLHVWIGVFMLMLFCTFLFKRQQYFFYNLITSPIRRETCKV